MNSKVAKTNVAKPSVKKPAAKPVPKPKAATPKPLVRAQVQPATKPKKAKKPIVLAYQTSVPVKKPVVKAPQVAKPRRRQRAAWEAQHADTVAPPFLARVPGVGFVPTARPLGAYFSKAAATQLQRQFGHVAPPEVFGLGTKTEVVSTQAPALKGPKSELFRPPKPPTTTPARAKAVQSFLKEFSAMMKVWEDKFGVDVLYNEFLGDVGPTDDAEPEWIQEYVDRMASDLAGVDSGVAGRFLNRLLSLSPSVAASLLFQAYSGPPITAASVSSVLLNLAADITANTVTKFMTTAFDTASHLVDTINPEIAKAISTGGTLSQPKGEYDGDYEYSGDYLHPESEKSADKDIKKLKWSRSNPPTSAKDFAAYAESRRKDFVDRATGGKKVSSEMQAAIDSAADRYVERLSRIEGPAVAMASAKAAKAAKAALGGGALQENPTTSSGAIPLFAGGMEPGKFHNGLSHISSYQDAAGFGMHVEGSQLLCQLGVVANTTTGEMLLPIVDGCDIVQSTYLKNKAIACNPLSFGFLLRELANNFAQYRINHLEVCIGTRVGVTTIGQYVMGYHSDGALDDMSPGAVDLSAAICDSFQESRMCQPYTNCGSEGGAMANCFVLPRETGPNGAHWFYTEYRDAAGVLPAVGDAIAEKRQSIDGYICVVNMEQGNGGEPLDVAWATVSMRYSITFRSPAFDTTFRPPAISLGNRVLGDLAPVFWDCLSDPRILMCVAWLLGLKYSVDEEPEGMEKLIDQLVELGMLPVGANLTTLLPPFVAYLRNQGSPPGYITASGWSPVLPSLETCKTVVPFQPKQFSR